MITKWVLVLCLFVLVGCFEDDYSNDVAPVRKAETCKLSDEGFFLVRTSHRAFRNAFSDQMTLNREKDFLKYVNVSSEFNAMVILIRYCHEQYDFPAPDELDRHKYCLHRYSKHTRSKSSLVNHIKTLIKETTPLLSSAKLILSAEYDYAKDFPCFLDNAPFFEIAKRRGLLNDKP